ncbi:MAG TPA: bifunctional folylpolyglutamate synthase/dihydrofolate synthase, partial [Sorangium sp.]|nr:bifunctional folylpolyglutamate synthase/dihydrofolate synthase [Sorangium sp.]
MKGPPATDAATVVPSLATLEQQLLARASSGAKLGLGRVREALTALGAPQNNMCVAHVAGTNGKGSSCAMLESIARHAGVRTGLSTSPHLRSIAERIRLNGSAIDDAALRRALALALDQRLPPLSFFEVMTVAALAAMKQARSELAIIEVGLGGRLDASNVVAAPQVVAVTSVARDHMPILGDRIDAIAREKIAISRSGRPLVLGPLAPAAAEAVAAYCDRIAVGEVWQVARSPREARHNRHRFGHRAIHCHFDGKHAHITPPRGPSVTATLALAGTHQADNAAVAVGMALLLNEPRIDAAALKQGLEKVVWPGRMERRTRAGVTVWLDCAHNPHAAAALCQLLARMPRPRRRALVFGAMADKCYENMLKFLAPWVDDCYYCP